MQTIDIDINEIPVSGSGLPTYDAIERGTNHKMDGRINDIIDDDRNFLTNPSRLGERFPGIWEHLKGEHGITEEPIFQPQGGLAADPRKNSPQTPWRYSNGTVEVNVHDVESRPASTVGTA